MHAAKVLLDGLDKHVCRKTTHDVASSINMPFPQSLKFGVAFKIRTVQSGKAVNARVLVARHAFLFWTKRGAASQQFQYLSLNSAYLGNT